METIIERPLSGNQFNCNYKFTPRKDFDSTYRRIHQAANFISYNTNPHSVTREDFSLKCLEPKDSARTSNKKCMPSVRKSRNLSQNEGQYENINPSLIQKLDGISTTFKRVMQAADILPAGRYQKSVTAKDCHPKPFDINDYLFTQSMDGRAISGPSKDTSAILSTLHEKGPFDKEASNRHTDYEKDVRDTKCTFLRVMQAVDWESPEPISKTIYETDYVRKLSSSPSRIINKSLLNPPAQDGESSHICNNVSKLGKHFEGTASPRMHGSNDNKGNITKNFRKKRVDLPDNICKKETHLPKFQYSEPLLFPSNHSEMTTPLVNAKDVCKRWSQIMENTQAKHNKSNLKLDGKCLPCYKKSMNSPEKCSEQSHTFVPTTTEQVLDKCKQPKYIATLENINPNYFRRDDFADSTNKRVYQAADRVASEVPPLSETAESLQKTVELLPEAKAAEKKANIAVPSKAKSYAEFISPNVGEFPFTKEPYFRSSDLRNIISGDAYMGYDRNLKSVTKSDFNPKMPSYEKGTDVLDCRIPRSSPRVQFRKTRSQLADLHCPNREGIIKFMDDEDPSLLRNHRR
ncbi:hypothetical protein AVEN_60230-1 [Araneus ventricosus]|uniref:Uncharacterized protein n=1 Tax=Araneus ventricosus TaxID=182803 RepID=A0A4Y2CKV0_ARAVE|nr:hypothetical protein AVEN_60230-1 [Araneus ventricosus]